MSLRSVLRRFLPAASIGPEPTSADVFRAILEQSADVILHVEDRRIVYISPSATRVFGWNPDDLIGQDALSMVYSEDRPAVEAAVVKLLSGQETSSSAQCRAVCGDGSLRWCETNTQLDYNEKGGHRAVLIMRDTSDRKRLEEQLAALALQDGLTGLANRRAFDQTLDRVWKKTLGSGGEMALLLLDLDCFKQFNDMYGHQAGDDCLRTIAACVLKYSRRPEDVACRYGGEELAVILSDTGGEAACAIAESIRASVLAMNIPHEGSFCGSHVTVSIGVAAAISRIGGTIRMPETLLQAADHALYKAKSEGRNRVEQSILIAPDVS